MPLMLNCMSVRQKESLLGLKVNPEILNLGKIEIATVYKERSSHELGLPWYRRR